MRSTLFGVSLGAVAALGLASASAVEDAPPVITLDLASADVDPTGTRDVSESGSF